MKFLRWTRHVASIAALLLIVGSLFALDMKLHQLQPQLVAAQQERVRAQQQADTTRSNSIPSLQPGTSAVPTPNSDQSESARRIEEIDIQRKMLLWTCVLAIAAILFGIAQGFLLYFQTSHTRTSAAAARISADAAQSAIVVAHRPWVSLDVVIGSPMSYDAVGWDAGPRWHVAIGYAIRNVGKTPALGAVVKMTVVPFIIGPTVAADGTPIDNHATNVGRLIQELTVFEDRVAIALSSFGGRILFPNEEHSGLYRVNINPALIDAALESSYYSGQFVLVAAVTYKTQLSEQTHSTAKAFHLFKQSGTQRIDLTGETIAVGELGLVSYPVHVDKAT